MDSKGEREREKGRERKEREREKERQRVGKEMEDRTEQACEVIESVWSSGNN